jgi:hypothetical protein
MALRTFILPVLVAGAAFAQGAVAVAFAGALDPARLKLDHSLAPLPDGPQRTAIDAVVRKAGLEVQQVHR